MDTPIRVLLLEDSPDDAELVLLQLRRAGYAPVFERVQTAEDMKAALGRESWDAVVSDYSMPGFNAPAALNVLKESGQDLPFVVVSGSIGEDTAVETMKAGAHDYLLKQNLTRLVPVIQREMREAENRRGRAAGLLANQRLQAERDALLDRLKEENEDLVALTRVTANAISTLELDELLRVLLERVVEVMHADTATILLARGDELSVRASVGTVNLRDSTMVKHIGEGFTGLVAASRKPRYVEDAATDPLVTDPLIRERGIRSILGVPLKRNGALIGVLHVDWLYVRPCRDRDVHMLEITAERCAAAIQNARLYEEARRTAAALAESEARSREHASAIEQTDDAVMITDREGRIRYVNAAFERISGYAAEEVLGRAPSLLKSGKHKPEFFEKLWRTILGGQAFRAMFINRRRDESLIYEEMTISPVRDDRGAITGFVSTAKDITEERRQTDALRESEERFQQLVKHIDDVFWMTDVATNRMIYVSPACEEVWGQTSASLLESPQRWFDAIHPEDLAGTRESALKHQNSGAYDREYRIIRPDGEVRWIHDRAFPIKDAAGKVFRIAGVANDITERKQAEEAVRSSLREKEALLKEVHHRVKNNLQVITSLLRLEGGRSQEPATRSVLQDMQGRIQAMALLHETLYRSGTFAWVDLGAYVSNLVAQSVRTLNTRPGSIQIDLDVAPVQVGIDQAIPCGILLNELVSNCLKHGFPDGRTGGIRVELQRNDGGPHLRLRVSDTGVGLPADFESKRGGSLGLQLVSDLARQIGGRLEVESGPGAVFSITFAVAQPRALTPDPDQPRSGTNDLLIRPRR